MFELNPPHNPLSAVITTHKYILSLPFPVNNLGALVLSEIDLVKFKIIFCNFSLYGLPFSAFS